jgi:hypothetical protein
MVRMMDVRSEIRKTPFFRTINPEKMINRIFYLNNPPNDPSSSEYSLKRLFNFETVKLYRWLFNPAVTPSKICASNLQSTKNFPNPPIRAALRLHPLGEPQPSQISSPLPPQPPSNSWRADPEMAPKRSNEKDGKGKES